MTTETEIRQALGTAVPCEITTINLLESNNVATDAEFVVETKVEVSNAILYPRESNPDHRLIVVLPRGSLTLDKVTLRNGWTDDVGGGCVFVGAGSTLVARDVVFEGCRSTYQGGASNDDEKESST